MAVHLGHWWCSMQFQVGGHGVRAGCKYVPGISAAGPASAICVRVLLSCPYVHALACVRVCIMCIQCIVCVCCCCVRVYVCVCVCHPEVVVHRQIVLQIFRTAGCRNFPLPVQFHYVIMIIRYVKRSL